jgi:hypothetical protein
VTMQYQATLTGVEGLERPLICNAAHLETVRDWAKRILNRYPDGKVEIWQTTIILREVLRKQPVASTELTPEHAAPATASADPNSTSQTKENSPK